MEYPREQILRWTFAHREYIGGVLSRSAQLRMKSVGLSRGRSWTLILLGTLQLGWPLGIILNWHEKVFICLTPSNNEILNKGCPWGERVALSKGMTQRRTQLKAACCQYSMRKECFSLRRKKIMGYQDTYHKWGQPKERRQERLIFKGEGEQEERATCGQTPWTIPKERGKAAADFQAPVGNFSR